MTQVIGVAWQLTAGVLAQATEAPAVRAVAQKTLLDYIQAGGFVGYLLIVVSVVALALVITNMVQLRRTQLAPPDSVIHLDQLIRANRMTEVLQYCQMPEAQSFLTRVLGMALVRCGRSPFGFLEIRTAVEEAGQKEMDRVARPTDAIGLIASLGPMLGLLGTVIGMIGAFATIGGAEGAARSQLLATYMSMALVTTAEGLIVAIPATVAYAIFRKRTERLAAQVGETIEEWLPYLEPAGTLAPAGAQPGPRPRGPGAAGAGAAQARRAGQDGADSMRLKAAKPLEEATFDLTPMIDIVLLLIIFFMLTTHFARSQQTAMDLPHEKGEPQRTEAQRSEIVIDLEKTGAMKVLNEPVTLDKLTEMLRSQRGGFANTKLVIRAERTCPAAHLNQLAGALLPTLGVRDWRLATSGEGP